MNEKQIRKDERIKTLRKIINKIKYREKSELWIEDKDIVIKVFWFAKFESRLKEMLRKELKKLKPKTDGG